MSHKTSRAKRIKSWFKWSNSNVDLVVIVAVLLIVGGSLTFIEIADWVNEGESQHFDEHVIRLMRNETNPAEPVGPRWFQEACRDISALGGPAVLLIFTAAVAGFLIMRRLHGALWVLLAASIGGLIFTMLLKEMFNRPRPEIVPHLSAVYTASFPSGHSMLSAVVYLTLGTLLARLVDQFRHKLYIVVVAVVLTLLIGITRVYLGVHYPTDVLAGWAAGLSYAFFIWVFAHYLQHRGELKPTIDKNEHVHGTHKS